MPFPDVSKVFDSNSRDLYGRPCASGFCVLISMKGIENLAEYLRLTSKSSVTNSVLPFELKGVKCISNDNMVIGLESKDITNSNIIDSSKPMKQSTIDTEKVNCIRNIQTFRKRMRTNESTRQSEVSLAKMREYISSKKQNETPQQRKDRLTKANSRKKAKRQNESTQHRESRLTIEKNAKKGRRQNETIEQRETKLAIAKNVNKTRKQNKTIEQREARLVKDKNAYKARKQNETTEQREATPAKDKERNRASRKN